MRYISAIRDGSLRVTAESMEIVHYVIYTIGSTADYMKRKCCKIGIIGIKQMVGAK